MGQTTCFSHFYCKAIIYSFLKIMIVFGNNTLITQINEGFYLTGKLLLASLVLSVEKDIKRALKSDTISTDSVFPNLLLKVCRTLIFPNINFSGMSQMGSEHNENPDGTLGVPQNNKF